MSLRQIARRKHNETRILEVRSLTTADLELLRLPTPPASPPKRLRDRHHHMAFLIALGKPIGEIAAELRMSPIRISQLQRAPACIDLITKYREEIETSRREHLREFGAAAAHNMTLAETELRTRLEANPTAIPIRDLNRIATDRMDRFGYPKKTLSDNRTINVNFAANLEAAIARSREAK